MASYRKLYFSTRNRVCPKCLKDYGYIKKFWDIKFITTCIEHECFLIETCPSCKKYLHYNRKSICNCNCGFDLLSHESKKVELEADLELSKLVMSVCNYISTDKKRPLEKAELNEIVGSFLLVARVILIKPLPAKQSIPIIEFHDCLKTTFEFFRDCPTNCYKYLEEKYGLASGETKAIEIFLKEFSYLFNSVHYKEINKDLFLLREVFQEYYSKRQDRKNQPYV